MKLKVNQADLQAGLQAVTRAVSTRTTLPVLTGILMEAKSDGLLLTGTDLELAVRARIPITCEEQGEIVLPARYLTEFVRRVPHGEISISTPSDAYKATLQWERSEYVLQGFPPEQFPVIEPVAGPTLSFSQPQFRQMLRQTSFAVSNDETRPALTGVHLSIHDGKALAIATDGFRVSLRRADLSGSGPLNLILPGRSLNEVTRLLGDDPDLPAKFRASHHQAEFDLGDIRLISRLVEGQYPKVLDLLPTEYPVRVTTERGAFQEAVERASLLADSRHTARWLIILEIRDDRITITASDPEVGQGYEEVSADSNSGDLRIGLNARFLLDGLRHIDDENVLLELIDPGKGIRISSPEKSDYQYVVFPVRL